MEPYVISDGVSLTPAQFRAEIRHIFQIDGLSASVVGGMTGIDRAVLRAWMNGTGGARPSTVAARLLPWYRKYITGEITAAACRSRNGRAVETVKAPGETELAKTTVSLGRTRKNELDELGHRFNISVSAILRDLIEKAYADPKYAPACLPAPVVRG